MGAVLWLTYSYFSPAHGIQEGLEVVDEPDGALKFSLGFAKLGLD